MSIKYKVIKNPLSKDTTSYIAKVVDEKVYNRDEFIDLVLLLDPSLVRGQAEANLSAIERAFKNITEQGASVALDIFKSSFSIRGVINSPDDTFDPSKQQVVLHINPSQSSKLLLSKLHIEKVYGTRKKAGIISFIDARSGLVNNVLTSGGAFTCNVIKAKVMASAQKDNSEGCYFIDKSDNTEYKVSTLIKNTTTEIIGETPTLSAGSYYFELRTYFGGSNKPTKTIKNLRLNNTLTVS